MTDDLGTFNSIIGGGGGREGGRGEKEREGKEGAGSGCDRSWFADVPHLQ